MRAGLGGQGSSQPGMPGKPTSTSSRPTRLMIADAVPLVGAGGGDLVAQRLQPHQRQLVLACLGLLQREHVDVVTRSSRASTRSMRERRELTFQVAMRTLPTYDAAFARDRPGVGGAGYGS